MNFLPETAYLIIQEGLQLGSILHKRITFKIEAEQWSRPSHDPVRLVHFLKKVYC